MTILDSFLKKSADKKRTLLFTCVGVCSCGHVRESGEGGGDVQGDHGQVLQPGQTRRTQTPGGYLLPAEELSRERGG